MSVKTKKTKKKNAGALNKGILSRVKSNPELIGKIIIASRKSYPTIMRWIDDNSQFLTQASCLNLICEELNISQSEALKK